MNKRAQGGKRAPARWCDVITPAPAPSINARRQATFRKRLIAQGGRVLTVAMPGEINELLAAEMKRTGESAQAVVLRLLRDLDQE